MLVLLAIADCANDEGWAWPSQETLAKKTRMSERQVRRIVKDIQALGEIDMHMRQEGRKRHNFYRVTVGQDVRSLPMTVGHFTSLGEDTAVSYEPRTEPSKKKTSSSSLNSGKRQPDLLWERLLSECGVDADSLTKSARGSANAALKQMKEVGATPEEITRRATRFRSRYASITLTPTALAKHWPQLGGGARSNGIDPLAHMRLPKGEKA